MRLSSSALAIGLAFLVLAASDRVERKAFVKRGDHFGEGRLEEVAGVRILHLHGRPFELGYEQGALLKAELAKRDQEDRDYARRNARQFTRLPAWLGRPLLGPILAQRARELGRDLDPESREELRGMAQGSGLSSSKLLALDLIFGLAQLHDGLQFALGPPASKPKELWHGFSSRLGEADQAELAAYQAVIFYHPEGRLKFVSIGLIGAPGVVTGMNEAGITISWSGGPGAIATAQTARAVLEQARTLDQAAGILQARVPGPSGAILIGSGSEAQALLLKASGRGWDREEMKDGRLGSGACWPEAGPIGPRGLKPALDLAGAGCGGEPQVARLGVVYDPTGNRVWIALDRPAAGQEQWAEVDFASETLREPEAFPGTLNSNP